MSYATYEDYLDVYHGTVLTAEQFTIYSDRASDYIDRITMGVKVLGGTAYHTDHRLKQSQSLRSS